MSKISFLIENMILPRMRVTDLVNCSLMCQYRMTNDPEPQTIETKAFRSAKNVFELRRASKNC